MWLESRWGGCLVYSEVKQNNKPQWGGNKVTLRCYNVNPHCGGNGVWHIAEDEIKWLGSFDEIDSVHDEVGDKLEKMWWWWKCV